MSNWLTNYRNDNFVSRSKNRLGDKYRGMLREKAIEQAKVEIALAGKRVSDYDHDQLEVIVKAQEDKLVAKYRNSTFVVLLLALGIY